MYLNRPVMKADRQLVGFIRFVFNPALSVINHLNEIRLDKMRFDAKIDFGRTVVTCPTPYLIEHTTVQAA